MRYLFLILSGLMLFTACNNSGYDAEQMEADSLKIVTLEEQVQQLEFDKMQQDSVVNTAISFFNQIQANLAKISDKEREIKVKSTDPELSADDQEWILEEIKQINALRQQNSQTIQQLRHQLSDKDIRIEELKNMTNNLAARIDAQNQEIESLKDDLADLNMEYAALFDEYQEQVELAMDVMNEINEVYYAYGTKRELMDNNIIEKEGGFLGIGRETNMADDLNEGYFQKIDKSKVHEINVVGKKPKIVTDHPVSSYEWDENTLKINDIDAFWKVSKYLVIQVK